MPKAPKLPPEEKAKREAEAVKLLRENLIDLGLIPGSNHGEPAAAGDEDADEILQLSIESETDFTEAMTQLVSFVDDIDVQLAGIDARKKTLDARKSRLAKSRDTLKATIAAVMQTAETPKLPLGIATLSLAPTPVKVEVVEEADIPSAYWKQADPVLDKKKLLDDLKERQETRRTRLAEIADLPAEAQAEALATLNAELPEIPGATLSQPGVSLRILTK